MVAEYYGIFDSNTVATHRQTEQSVLKTLQELTKKKNIFPLTYLS